MEDWKEDWYGNKSHRIEDIERPPAVPLDYKISITSDVEENENTVNNIPNKVPSEAERNTDAFEIRLSNPALQERSQHEENNVLSDGSKNSELADLLLSSKELPSWATRQTAAVPPNTHRIAECQGCMKEHGAPHTCDMREEGHLRYSDMPPGVYPAPSNRHPMMPPTIMNPYGPGWSEGHEMHPPPSWRHPPPLPPWRQDQNAYHGGHHGYEKHYCECEDEYVRHYPLDAYGRHQHHHHEANRAPPHPPHPHEAYMPQLPHGNQRHSYGAIHDPAFLRTRHMEEHPPPPPPSHFHQYSARQYPYIPMSGQALTGNEWQSRSLQNFSKYEPPQVPNDAFVDRINSRGDWSQHEVDQSKLTYDTTSHSDVSSLSQPPLYTTKTQSESQSNRMENYQSPFQTYSPAGDFNEKACHISETKTSNNQEVLPSAENKTNLTEKSIPAPPADYLQPHVISTSTSANNNNKAITSNNGPADSRTTVNEAIKSNEEALSMKISSSDSTPLVDIVNQETLPTPYTRKSPCAFTIDISPVRSSTTDPFSTAKLPANLAKRVAKFPRKTTPKDDKSEKSQQAALLTVTQQKKERSLHTSKQLADDKDRKSSKVKYPQHVSSNNREEDDCDDDDRSDTYQERLQWTKPMVWTKVEANALKNDQHFKSSEAGLRGTTSVATSKAKSTTRSDDKTRNSLEFERPSVLKDNPSIASRKYASVGHKFSHYPEQIGPKVSFQTPDDTSSELSETETYTICTSEQDSAVAAAREKIAEVFRVGMTDEASETEIDNGNNDRQRSSFVDSFIDDENDHTEEEDTSEDSNSLKREDSPELENLTELAVEVCERKPGDISQKSDEDSCLNMKDSDDVICVTYGLYKDSVDDRKPKNETESNSASSFPMSSTRSTSLSKRLLPRTPGKDGPADRATLVFEPADTRSHAGGDSDKGFFEILSSDAPPMRMTEQKKNSSISETYEKLRTDGEFEVIADAPRAVEDAGLDKEMCSDDDVLDFLQQNKVPRNSLNKKGPSTSSCSQSEDEELKKIFFDEPQSSRVNRTTGIDEREGVSDNKPKFHNMTGKLHSTPRYYDTDQSDDASLNRSQKPLVCNSLTTSKTQTLFSRGNNQERSSNEGFVPLNFGRSSVRAEGRKLPGSPTKPVNNSKSEFISRGRPNSGGRRSLRETDHEGVNSYGTISLSQPSTPRLAQRVTSIHNQRLMENPGESRPPLSGSRQKTLVSKAVSHSSAAVAEPGTPSRTLHARQRSLSRPTFSRGDPQISLSRPPLPRGDTQISLSRPSLSSRDDANRQHLKFLNDCSFESSDTTKSMPLSRPKQHQIFKGQRIGEAPKTEKATSYDNEARMKRSKSVTTGLRSRTSDVDNPKLQAYHDRMKYDPRKAIQDSKKHRLSASSNDTDAGSYEELQNHHQLTRQRPGSMTHADRNSRKTSDYQLPPRGSLNSGTRPRSARTRMSPDERLNHSTSTDIDAAYGVHPTTIPSIQNLSEDIQHLLNKIEQDKARTRPTTQVTGPSANRATTSSANDPQLNELRRTLKKVKQVLQSKFHS